MDTAKEAAENAAKSYKEISGKNIDVSVEGILSDDGCVYSATLTR